MAAVRIIGTSIAKQMINIANKELKVSDMVPEVNALRFIDAHIRAITKLSLKNLIEAFQYSSFLSLRLTLTGYMHFISLKTSSKQANDGKMIIRIRIVLRLMIQYMD